MNGNPERRRELLLNHIQKDHEIPLKDLSEPLIKDRLYPWHRKQFPKCEWTINGAIKTKRG